MTNGRPYLKRKQSVLCWLSQRLYNITKVYFLPYCIHHAFKIKCAVFMNNNVEILMDLIIYSILWVTKFSSCCFCFTVFARSCEETVLRRNYVSVFIVIMGHSVLPSAVIWWFSWRASPSLCTVSCCSFPPTRCVYLIFQMSFGSIIWAWFWVTKFGIPDPDYKCPFSWISEQVCFPRHP